MLLLDEALDAIYDTHMASLVLGERASSHVLESPPGVGKSEGVFQVCARMAAALGEPVGLVQFMLTTVMSADVRGFMLPLKAEEGKPLRTVFSTPPWYPATGARGNMWVVTPEGEWYMPGTWEGDIPRVGIVFLDEWGQAEDDVKKPAAELLLNGNVGSTFLPLGWRVLAAQNRTSDRSGVMREMMFTVNRRCLVPISPDIRPWLRWVDSVPEHKRPHFMTVSFARQHPNIVFAPSVPDGTDPFCTPRSLCKMDQDLQALASDEDRAHNRLPITNIARAICAGWIGEGVAGQFFTHLKFFDVLPEMEDVIDDPRSAKLPPGKDAQMVVAYMLAHHVDEDNAQPIMRYIARMNEEMQMMTMAIVNGDERRLKHLVVVPEYTSWMMKNKDRLRAAQM